MIHPRLKGQDRSFWCQGWWKHQAQYVFWRNEAVEVIEAAEVVEAVEVIEAAEVPDAREITQYVKCKVWFSVKMHEKAKNDEKKIENSFTFGTFKLFSLKSYFEFLHIIL